MNKSESIKELATALALAQAEMAGARKDSTNPHFKSKYADLASVWEAARPALTKHGLSITQFAVPSERNEVQVETTILHSSGEWMSGIMAMPVTKNDAHGYGSALTYCRRYSLAAAVGIAPEDDDGQAAVSASTLAKVTEANQADKFAADWETILKDCETKDDLKKQWEMFRDKAMALPYGAQIFARMKPVVEKQKEKFA